MRKAWIFLAVAVAGTAQAQITNYTDQYGRPVGAAIQQGNMTFYTDGQGRPIGSAIGGQPSSPPQFQQQPNRQPRQSHDQDYTGPSYSINTPSRYVPDSREE